jgi:sulfur carrier protein
LLSGVRHGERVADRRGGAPTARRDRAMITITVNGKQVEVADGVSIEALLAQLGVRREYTAVAVNREVTPKSHYAETRLRDGDKVEIVRPMGGG